MTTEQRMYSPELYELDLSQLLNKIGIDSPTFIGQAKRSQNGLFFENIYSNSDSKSGVLLSDPIYGYNLKVDIIQQNGSIDIKEGKYYKFRIEFAENKDIRIERNQPFLFRAIDIEEAENPYYNDVKIAFQRNTTNPSSNQRDAKLLEEIGKNMYSSKERMFYELIQNADDSAASNGVKIFAKTDQDYLIIKYNGYSFNKDDFEAITSAANGTKKTNENKTGYKGIGFKSVFTDSTQVYIKTGGYQFRFDKNDKVFEDFDSFYLQNNPTLTNEESKKEFLKLFDYDKKHFNGVHSIPWQLEPIWTDEYPLELGEDFANSNVAIALRLGMNKIEGTNGYQAAIDEIINNPKFMLFLRNTTHIDFNGKIISKQIQNNIISLENSFNEDTHNERFYLEEYCIDINNDVFEQSDIDIRLVIKEKDEQTGKMKEAVFVNNNNEEYENIPAKIAINSTTSISFALPVDENGALKLEPNNNDISMFAYLPTLVKDFHFPIYINANFILDPPRQRILGDNPWNFYLMQEIAKLLVKCCTQWSKQGDYNALNILIPHLFDEESSDIRFLSKYFNNAYKAALTETAFIFNYDNGLSRQDEIILDKTGLSNIIGADVFCKILGTSKFLPSNVIDCSILNNTIFNGIEHIRFDCLIPKILEGNTLFEWFKTASNEYREMFFEWVEKNIDKCQRIIPNLPLIKVADTPMSYASFSTKENFLLTTNKIIHIKDILYKLEFECSEEIWDTMRLKQHITPKKEKDVFDLIAVKLKDKAITLTPDEKHRLFNVLKEFDNVGEAALSNLYLFCNLDGTPQPLCNMMSFALEQTTTDSINKFDIFAPYIISKSEFKKELEPFLKQEFFIVWKNHTAIHKEKNISYYDLYNLYKDNNGIIQGAWLSSNTTDLINEYKNEANEYQSLLPIIEESDKNNKRLYLQNIKRIDFLPYSHYSKDSFEYRILQLALSVYETPSIFSEKIFYKRKCIKEYTTKDDVVCKYSNGASYTLSLAKILPQYNHQTESIESILQMFDKNEQFEDFFDAISKPLKDIYEELNTLLGIPEREFPVWNVAGNPQQFLFEVYYRKTCKCKSWFKTFVPKLILTRQSDSFINELLDFTYTNKISFPSEDFTGRYFDNEYILSSEKINPIVEKWANTIDKKGYLIEKMKVKDINDITIKFRKDFIQDTPIDYISDISEQDIILSFLNYISSEGGYKKPFEGQYQREFLLQLAKKDSRLKPQVDITTLASCSLEWEIDRYTEWRKEHYPSIFIYDELIPQKLMYNGVTLLCYNEHLYHYDKPNKKLYISNTKKIEEVLFDVVKECSSDIDWDEYRELCLDDKEFITKDELEKKDETIKTQSLRIEELENELNLYKEKYEQHVNTVSNISIGFTQSNQGTGTITNGDEQELSDVEKIDAQLEAQQCLMEMHPEWTFPEGYGTANDNYTTVEVTDKDGNNIPIILKSYIDRNRPFKITTSEWDFLMKKDAWLLIYTIVGNSRKDIVLIRKKDILSKQSLSLSFSTKNLDGEDNNIEEKINSFSDALHYFKELHFDFESFNIPQKAKSIKDIYTKHDGNQYLNSDDDL